MSQKDLLIGNLVEISHAVSYSTSEQLPLTANWQGTRLYDSRYGWGRIWHFFFRLCHLVTCQDVASKKLRQAILHTHAAYLHCLPEIACELTKYKIYLLQASKGYKVEENELLPSRHLLASWCAQTRPFIKLAVEAPDPRLARLLHLCGQQNEEKLFNAPQMDALAPCRKILKLEGQSRGPLPLALFRKTMKGKPLDAVEIAQLEKWIKKSNKRAVPIKTLYQATEAVALLNQKHGSASLQQAALRLQLLLDDHGCKSFQQPDKRSLLWQQSLKTGMRVQHQGCVFSLSSEIPSRKAERHSDHDLCRVFTLAEEPEKVLVVASNPFLLKMRSSRTSSKEVCGIEQAAFESIASNGLTALMERLRPLNCYQWGKEVLTSSEEALIGEVSALLARFVAENYTPVHFNDSTILFDKRSQLLSLKPMIRGRFDFDSLEEFVFHFSAGQLPIFQKVMQASKLFVHPVAKFYYEAAVHALQDDPIAIEDLAGIYKIGSAKVVDRATDLTKRLLEISQQIYAKCKRSYPDAKPDALKKAVREAVLEHYRATQAGGILIFGASDIPEGKIFDKIDAT